MSGFLEMQIAVAFYCSPLSRIFCHKCTCISVKFESLEIALVVLVWANEGTASLVMSALSNYVADILRRFFWYSSDPWKGETLALKLMLMELANPSRFQLSCALTSNLT